MDSTFLQSRIDAVKLQIVAYETAITAIVEYGAQSYTLNTSQSQQSVTKLDLPQLEKTLDSLFNRLATLQARQKGGNVLHARIGF